jgi:predicted membrane protein
MKMGAGLFWGLILILIGIGIVIRVVFNIDFPVVKFLIAFFFIFIGIKILVGNFDFRKGHGDNTTIFGESKIVGLQGDQKEYNVIFGSSVIDLRDIDLTEGSKEIEINTIFGGTVLKIDDKTPVKIKAEAVFGNAELPNGNSATFGSNRYESESFNKDTSYLYIKTDVVFGSLKVRSY